MTQCIPLRSTYRPLRTALICSAAALAVSLGGGVAFADDDDDDGGRRGGDRRGWHDSDHRGRGGDRHYRGHDGRNDRDYGRGSRYYGSGRSHRDPGYRHRDDHYYRQGSSHHGGYGSSYRGGHYDGRYSHSRFVAPRHLYRQYYRDYDRYYHGSVFYAPHRHSHRVYNFPVIIGGYAEYRPYAYCGDAYYPDHYGHYYSPRGQFGLHFSF